MKATNFTLPSTNKKNFTLKESLGKYVVLYFYPKDDTPGCTIETNDFNKLYSKFKKLDCEVYGISKDNIKSHDKFREKYKVKFDLLSDEKKEALKAFVDKGNLSSGRITDDLDSNELFEVEKLDNFKLDNNLGKISYLKN